MAEYIARSRYQNVSDFESAGFKPQAAADAENAVYTLERMFGIDASGHQPRGILGIAVHGFDFVVVMKPSMAEEFTKAFPTYPTERVVRWNIRDPWGDNLMEYRQAAQDIIAALGKLPFLKEASSSDESA